MPTIIDAAILYEPNQPFVIEKIQLKDPNENEVLVKIVSTGVCHTDYSIQHIVPKPIILGHEGAGIVMEIGKNVSRVKPGDKVVLTFGSCGSCQCCVQGEQAYCYNGKVFQFSGKSADDAFTVENKNNNQIYASFFQQSSFANYAIATERNVIKVNNDNIPLELLGPLGCGIQTGAGAVLNSLKVNTGNSLVVFGAGSVGLSAIMAANIVGCNNLVAVDINNERLNIAQKLGATHIINSKNENVIDKINEITNGKGSDFSLETAGTETTFKNAIDCLSNLGTCGIVTTPLKGQMFPFSPTSILLGGKKLIGILMGSSIPEIFIPKLINLYIKGKLPFDTFVKYYKFNEINQAVEDSKKGKIIKPILLMD